MSRSHASSLFFLAGAMLVFIGLTIFPMPGISVFLGAAGTVFFLAEIVHARSRIVIVLAIIMGLAASLALAESESAGQDRSARPRQAAGIWV